MIRTARLRSLFYGRAVFIRPNRARPPAYRSCRNPITPCGSLHPILGRATPISGFYTTPTSDAFVLHLTFSRLLQIGETEGGAWAGVLLWSSKMTALGIGCAVLEDNPRVAVVTGIKGEFPLPHEGVHVDYAGGILFDADGIEVPGFMGFTNLGKITP